MKKIIAMLIAMAIQFSNAAAMPQEIAPEPEEQPLYGTWELYWFVDGETAQMLLENVEFYPEEIELLDKDIVYYCQRVEFDPDGTYRFYFDAAGTWAAMREYYDICISDLYDQRSSLTETYGDEILDMSYGEFCLFYAELFSLSSYDSLLDYFADYCLDYEELSAPYDAGTFWLERDKIWCTEYGDTEAMYLDYYIEEDMLYLGYSDGEEVYTRCSGSYSTGGTAVAAPLFLQQGIDRGL